MFCLGISPFDAHGWVLPKSLLMEYVIGHGMGQHTGASGSDTSWIGFPADEPLEWMRSYGGTLAEARRVLKQMPRGRH